MGYMDDLFMTGNLTTSPTQNQKQEYDGKPKDGDRADLDVELEDENRKAEMSPEKLSVVEVPRNLVPKLPKANKIRRTFQQSVTISSQPSNTSVCILGPTTKLNSIIEISHVVVGYLLAYNAAVVYMSVAIFKAPAGSLQNGPFSGQIPVNAFLLDAVTTQPIEISGGISIMQYATASEIPPLYVPASSAVGVSLTEYGNVMYNDIQQVSLFMDYTEIIGATEAD